jgi:hypothetical protein
VVFCISENENFFEQAIPLNQVFQLIKAEHQGDLGVIDTVNKDAVITTAKACELFILDLTMRSWQSIVDGQRQNLTVFRLHLII